MNGHVEARDSKTKGRRYRVLVFVDAEHGVAGHFPYRFPRQYPPVTGFGARHATNRTSNRAVSRHTRRLSVDVAWWEQLGKWWNDPMQD